uniref:Uncharacterized protein n=1 Tax=Amphimedon queenslandica TaxID=400682 RepID=A0A1X7VHV3_AMPQE
MAADGDGLRDILDDDMESDTLTPQGSNKPVDPMALHHSSPAPDPTPRRGSLGSRLPSREGQHHQEVQVGGNDNHNEGGGQRRVLTRGGEAGEVEDLEEVRAEVVEEVLRTKEVVIREDEKGLAVVIGGDAGEGAGGNNLGGKIESGKCTASLRDP